MKNCIKAILLTLIYSNFNSQIIVDSEEYNERKRNNTLNGLQIISGDFTSTILPGTGHNHQSIVHDKTNSCDCYIAPDSTYILAMTPNDDGSSTIIDLPFDFCFYGDFYNQLYINNNGNITFENDLSTYSSNSFPSPDNKIIAPFWADVDTRGAGQIN